MIWGRLTKAVTRCVALPSTLIALLGLGVMASAAHAEDDWVKEELLLQMQALRQQVGELSRRVDQLESTVQQLTQRGGQAGQPLSGADSASSSPSLPPLPLGDPSLALGDDNAPLALIEFSDFECGFCKRHYRQVFPSLRHQYIDTGKLRYIQRDYPLDRQSDSYAAALVAQCAAAQGQYWPMRKQLWEAPRLNAAQYQLSATTIGLVMPDFSRCLDRQSQRQAVEQGIRLGAAVGAQGTPFFVLGRVVDNQLTDARVIQGARPLAAFTQTLDQLLAGATTDSGGHGTRTRTVSLYTPGDSQ